MLAQQKLIYVHRWWFTQPEGHADEGYFTVHKNFRDRLGAETEPLHYGVKTEVSKYTANVEDLSSQLISCVRSMLTTRCK